MFFLYCFYRIPRYEYSDDDTILISPAEGTVLRIDTYKSYTKVFIYLNVLNAHVQIIPYSGDIISRNHNKGPHKIAYNIDEKYQNSIDTILETKQGPLIITQNTGILARRIKNYCDAPDYVQKGDLMGIIKFGSRVDLTFPSYFSTNVKVGDKVRLGNALAQIKK